MDEQTVSEDDRYGRTRQFVAEEARVHARHALKVVDVLEAWPDGYGGQTEPAAVFRNRGGDEVLFCAARLSIRELVAGLQHIVVGSSDEGSPDVADALE